MRSIQTNYEQFVELKFSVNSGAFDSEITKLMIK